MRAVESSQESISEDEGAKEQQEKLAEPSSSLFPLFARQLAVIGVCTAPGQLSREREKKGGRKDAQRSNIFSRILKISLATMSISLAWPPAPPEGSAGGPEGQQRSNMIKDSYVRWIMILE